MAKSKQSRCGGLGGGYLHVAVTRDDALRRGRTRISPPGAGCLRETASIRGNSNRVGPGNVLRCAGLTGNQQLPVTIAIFLLRRAYRGVRCILRHQLAVDAVDLPRLLVVDPAPDTLRVRVVGVGRGACELVLYRNDVIVTVKRGSAVAGVRVSNLIAGLVIRDASLTFR